MSDIVGSAGWRRTSWRRSSRCGSGGACVEVAVGAAEVGVRDSKTGQVLVFGAAPWHEFVRAVRAGEFDRPGR
jgi:hypothetical protein